MNNNTIMWFPYLSESCYFQRAVWYFSIACWCTNKVWYDSIIGTMQLLFVLLSSLRSFKKVFHTWSKVSPFLITISCNLGMFRLYIILVSNNFGFKSNFNFVFIQFCSIMSYISAVRCIRHYSAVSYQIRHINQLLITRMINESTFLLNPHTVLWTDCTLCNIC